MTFTNKSMFNQTQNKLEQTVSYNEDKSKIEDIKSGIKSEFVEENFYDNNIYS